MWLSMACIVAGDSRYWRGARCCLCDRVMRCLGTTILKPTGSRRASSLYTERWRLVHFPCAHFQPPSPSCASHLKCVHISLLVGRMEKEVSRAATRATVGSASTTGTPPARAPSTCRARSAQGVVFSYVPNEHHLGVVHQPLIAVVKPGVLSTLLLDELLWRSKRT